MNAIPAASIKRIEVLRDSAAAQYGSDAIVGLINIVLNDQSEGGNLAVSYGKNTAGDGKTTNIDLSKGFINTTLNLRKKGFTNRSSLHGSCQFAGCTQLDSGDYLLSDSREATAVRNTFRIGDTDSDQIGLTINTGYDLADAQSYNFITYSSRDNESAAFFRDNANRNGNALLPDGDAIIPAGFLPKTKTKKKVTETYTPADTALGDISPNDVFSEQAISIIEEWQPKDHISLSGLSKIAQLNVNLAFNRYSEYRVLDGERQTYSAKLLTDYRLNYQVNDELSFNIWGNNIFDVYPDKNTLGNSRSGTIVDDKGRVVVNRPVGAIIHVARHLLALMVLILHWR